MAFTLSSFARGSSHANSDAPVIWVYRTNDNEATVEGAGYFNAVAGEVSVGDTIFIHLDADGSDTMEQTWVTANTGSVVTIQGLTNLAAS